MKLSRILRLLVCYLLLVWFSVLFLIPFFWSLSTSLTSKEQLYASTRPWIPDPIRWQNYTEAIAAIPFFTYLKNSVLVTLLSIVGVLLSSSLVAFGFGCLEWHGRDVLFVILLATMMLPAHVMIIPVFILFCHLGWVNTFKPLVVPAFLGGGAFFVFLLRQFFRTIPKDLFEAARLDGCSAFGIYWRIVLPLSQPALATVAIFTLNGTWNDFFGPLIYLNSEDMKTLALGLQSFSGQTGSEWSQLMAISLLMIVPVLAAFFVGQRYFVEGITLTGMKG